MNISNFIQWFLNEFIRIGGYILQKLGELTIYGNVSLLDFIITIAIISAFISLVVTAPNLGVVRREINLKDKNTRRQKMRENRKGGN